MLNFFCLLTAAGIMCFLVAIVTAIGSQSRYEDATPVFLSYLAVGLVVVGALGWLAAGGLT